MKGPYPSLKEACDAYAATLNREVPHDKFLQALHPDVVFATKYETIRGEIPVAFHLETQWNWSVDQPSSFASVTMSVRKRYATGDLRHYCALFRVERPGDIVLETYLALTDGWVSMISIRCPWMDAHYPFPERVVEFANRLRSRDAAIQVMKNGLTTLTR